MVVVLVVYLVKVVVFGVGDRQVWVKLWSETVGDQSKNCNTKVTKTLKDFYLSMFYIRKHRPKKLNRIT